MKENNPSTSDADKIDNLLRSIEDKDKNNIEGIFLDESLMEFFSLEKEIPIPAIAVGELDYNTGFEIAMSLSEIIPEYLRDHTLLVTRKPLSEQHSLHFIKPIPGKIVDFVHILRFDFKLTGGHGKITGKGNSQTFPEYSTCRIRYKSRLVPVLKGSDPAMIESLRLKSQLGVDSDGKRFTSVFFDEFSPTEISIDFSTKVGVDIYPISPKIYPFISYDYFTACLNIPDPEIPNIDRAVELFEPLFFFLYFQYRERDYEIDIKEISIFDQYLEINESEVTQKPYLQENLKDFFSRYALYRDDDLMLKGLRKIVINKN